MKLPRVHRQTVGGRIYRYHRETRAKLPDGLPEDHPDFVAAWLAEEQKAPAKPAGAAQGTIAAACDAFTRSRAFLDLNATYRRIIGAHVRAIREQGETALLRDLRPRHVRADLEPLTPSVAKTRLKAWRKLARFWRDRDMISADPVQGVGAKPMPKGGGHTEWTLADLEKFRAKWPIGTPQRQACELLQWTGARCIDVVQLGPHMVRGGVLSFSQAKTGVEVHIPWTIPAFGLEPERAPMLACISDSGRTFIRTRDGHPRSVKAFSQWFSAAARAAKLDDLTAHGLRKYRMNALAEAGASVLVMQAWVGHVTLAEVQRYTARADRRRAITGDGFVKSSGGNV